MASIRKRNGKFQAVIRRSGCKTQTRTFNKKKDASEWARGIELDIDRMGMAKNTAILSKTTLHDLLSKYRDTVIAHKKGHKNETIIVNAFMRNAFCHKSLLEITSEDFEKYKVRRLKNVKGSTINREFNIIKHAYNTAIKVWEYPLAKNPLDTVSKAPTPKPRERRLSECERKKLLVALGLSSREVHDLVVFALETAMRRGEILNIQNKHIDIENKTLLIPDSKNGYSRKIPLSPLALTIIAQTANRTTLFPISIAKLEYHWNKACTEILLSDYNFHSLRHEAISRFFERGLSIPEVALISGHRCYKMLARYTHLKAENIVGKL